MKTIVCTFQLFDMNQIISAIDDKGNQYLGISSTIDNLGKDIADLCAQEHINKVHLFGIEDYANQTIIPDIMQYSKSNYGLENIEVRIN